MKQFLRTSARLALTGAGALALIAPVATQAEDNSVKRRLDAAGQKYEVDKDGDFKMTFTFSEDKRSQVVIVEGAAYDIQGMQVRNIYAGVAKVGTDGIAAKATDLLKANNGFKIGAFEIQGDTVLLSLKIPDSATPEQLQKAVRLAASVADDKEKELSGARDTF
jgi:Putative bacterial sensory transduction regulator